MMGIFRRWLKQLDRNNDGYLNVKLKGGCFKREPRLVIKLTDEEAHNLENYPDDYTINLVPTSVYNKRARATVRKVS